LNRKFRMHDRLTKEHSGPFSNGRSVFARVPLTQGRYCIIPSTFEPGKIIVRKIDRKSKEINT
jgi:hypothetical protein